ncbi:phosphate ABC transporter permease PstA [Gemmatimonas groenlandica]|uniref:Phosphate transport system permease protein PstA n=1 Tax=Gemmatimonas groenlandica TaxID=2732249 RepID=A0A6M4IKT3_9BACT|nr:phosphate ABC transporter permease PstA [Gemmatimonas groenlandica]QJR34479.1 phosphate ABC transporter permease PstA [Gemmatimonas groenlandica]
MTTRARQRKRRGQVMTVFTWIAAAVAVIPLVLILAQLLLNGLGQLTPTFFTQMPSPPGVRGGGVANAIMGSILLVAIAMSVAVPIGIGAGLYLAEHRRGRFAQVVRLLADVLSGLPSIVLGIFAWELIVRPSGHFSAWAGGIALGLLVLPLVARATEEMVRLVPVALTEAALALGFSRWRTALTVVLRTAMPGIVTAVLIAMSRAAGETAPLLFTAFGNPFWSVDPSRPIAALPLQIYSYAQSPYDEWRAQAWAGALVLLILVTIISVIGRAVVGARAKLLSAVTPRVGRVDE